MSIFGGTARKAQKAAALREMKRDMERALTFGSLDPDTTNYAQLFRVATPMLIDYERSAAWVNPPGSRCPYCGVKRADDGKSCDGCGGHL